MKEVIRKMVEEEKVKYRLELLDVIYALQDTIKEQLREFNEKTGLQVQSIHIYNQFDGEIGSVKLSVGVEGR